MSGDARITIVIPARLASTRFPEKVLASKTGKPLVQHVVEAAAASGIVARGGRVVVATDHERVVAALKPFGTTVLMTSPSHPNGTSRLAEAAAILGLAADDIILNAQGDEPEMQGVVLDAAVAAFLGSSRASAGTVAAPFASGEDPRDPNVVKVVRDTTGHALYFSRSTIPFDRDGRALEAARPLRHIGVYVYRRAFLERYVSMPPTPLEQTEQLEQLRVLEHGHSIAVGVVGTAQVGIDTVEQYEGFVQRWSRTAGGGSGSASNC